MKQKAMKNKGFTLSEILAAVLIMSMMMIAIVSFVDYSSRIWRSGQTAVNSKNYSRLAFDLINQELMEAESIVTPSLNNSNIFLYLKNQKKTKVYRSITFENSIKKLYLYGSTNDNNYLSHLTGKKGSEFSKPENSSKVEEILLAKNVSTFTVTRLSTSTVQITLAIEDSEENEDGGHDIISSDTMVLYAPMIR